MRRSLGLIVLLLISLVAAWLLHGQLRAPQKVATTPSADAREPTVATPVSPAETNASPDTTITATKSPLAVTVTTPQSMLDDEPTPSIEPGTLLEKEAKTFINELTEPTVEPLTVEGIDHFVSRDQVLSLVPDASIEVTTLRELENDATLEPNTPVTLVKEVDQVEVVSRERLLGFAAGDLNKLVKVALEGRSVEITVGEALRLHDATPQAPIRLIKTAKYYEITNASELRANADLDADEPISIIRKPYRLETATVGQLLGEQTGAAQDSIFYVRTVTANDEQGIWGIVHNSLVDNFARGIALRRGEEINTYRVFIPYDADEKLSDNRSSFLGRLIHEKARASHTYNFKTSRMSQNPDTIEPGDELVIVNFTPAELIAIYKHFIDTQRNCPPSCD